MFLALALILAIGAPAYAQGSIFTTLSGTVVDAEGLPIPGANVKIKNNGTGQEIDLVSGGDGGFTAPNINSGSYSVIVELAGFRTTTLEKVSVAAGIPTAVKVTMQVGTIAENVTVVGESATVVQSQSPAISTNLTGAQITSLPLTSRNALDSLTSLAGFNTSGTARNSTVSGLPRSAINITLDGMSVQDNYLKTTDGYFARLSPLLDSVEEVTVTTAGNTADATGQGAVQIRFVTKAGTNQWNGTAYEYFRHDALNANTLVPQSRPAAGSGNRQGAEERVAQYTTGFAQGGPIKQNKAFFFFNYEEQRAPSSSTLQRVILTPAAASGIFSYNAAGGVQQQNLLQIAATNGQLATIDPTVAKILGEIQASTTQSGGVTAAEQPAGAAVHLVDADPELQPVADDAPRLRDHPQPSPDRIVQLSPHQLDARHDQQRAAALPEFAADRQPAVDAVDDVGVVALDVWRQRVQRVPRRRIRRLDAVLAGVRDRTCGPTPTAIASTSTARAAAPARS